MRYAACLAARRLDVALARIYDFAAYIRMIFYPPTVGLSDLIDVLMEKEIVLYRITRRGRDRPLPGIQLLARVDSVARTAVWC